MTYPRTTLAGTGVVRPYKYGTYHVPTVRLERRTWYMALKSDVPRPSDFELLVRDDRKHPPSVDRRVRIALKRILRGLGLRCVRIQPATERGENEATGDEGSG